MEKGIIAGNPCKRGHDGRRYKSNGDCVACTAERTAKTWATILADRRDKRNVERRERYGSDEAWRAARRAQSKASYDKREAVYRERRRERYNNDPEYREKIKSAAAKKRATPGYKENLSRYMRKRLYGLEHDEFEAMRAVQGNKCAICQRRVTLVVDHCHVTTKVRGLLCFKCNSGIGQFDESEERLTAAIEYIRARRVVQ